MNLVRWSPWGEMTTLQNRFNRMLDDPFFRIGRLDNDADMGMWNPTVDLYEKDNNFVIKAELPGVDKKDITIDLKDRVLTLSGERSYDNEVKEENYYRRERSYGKFQRAFTLPADVDSDKIKAEFKDGVLQVEVPKPEEQKPKQVTIH
ncbi:MAG: Hsp20/alpha crystallin family protein [Desulfobacterales bacterium]|nr:Hsp20/alpha crystallin family protein [Desulfobacterales bacterium]